MNMREQIYELYQMENRLKKSKELLNVQAQQGTWNYDAYMQGMYNGMELIVSTMEDREPIFKKAPEQWLHDIELPVRDTDGGVPTEVKG